jgi:carbonyl reductase 1
MVDVRDDASVMALAQALAGRHGGVDIVVSNAAARIFPQVPAEQQARTFVETNNHGTLRMIQGFGPLLNDGARFIVVASSFGTLASLDPRLHHLFDVCCMSLTDLAKVMDDYVAAVETTRAAAQGWPAWINPPSKVAQVAALKVWARELADEAARRDILVNAACPGLVDTDASRPWFDDMSGALSPDDAAADVLWPTLPQASASPRANSSSTARSSPSHRRPSADPRGPVSQAGQISNCSAGRFNGNPMTLALRMNRPTTWRG